MYKQDLMCRKIQPIFNFILLIELPYTTLHFFPLLNSGMYLFLCQVSCNFLPQRIPDESTFLLLFWKDMNYVFVDKFPKGHFFLQWLVVDFAVHSEVHFFKVSLLNKEKKIWYILPHFRCLILEKIPSLSRHANSMDSVGSRPYYYPSHLLNLLDGNQFPHRDNICNSLLDSEHWSVYMYIFIGEYHMSWLSFVR